MVTPVRASAAVAAFSRVTWASVAARFPRHAGLVSWTVTVLLTAIRSATVPAP